MEVKAEEEPKGEIIVGSSGEALRPPGKGTTFTQINSLFVHIYLDCRPLVFFYIFSSLVVRWDIWKRRWWGRGARNLHPRAEWIDWAWVFWTPFSFVLSCSLSLSLPMVTIGLPDLLLVFFSGAVPIASIQFSVVRGRMPAARGRLPGDQRPQTTRI